MLTPALGKVRAAGTCSFVTGVVAYCALATSFLLAALREVSTRTGCCSPPEAHP